MQATHAVCGTPGVTNEPCFEVTNVTLVTHTTRSREAAERSGEAMVTRKCASGLGTWRLVHLSIFKLTLLTCFYSERCELVSGFQRVPQ